MIKILRWILNRRRDYIRKYFNRWISSGDLLNDRWTYAQKLGFGSGTSCYDNVLIIGDVQVGCNCWIGPNVILDGSGGLKIGENVSVSAGVHIYTHHTVRRALTSTVTTIDRKETNIGSNVYIGPNSVIQMGVNIGDRCVIGALSFVNKDMPDDSVWYGNYFQKNREIKNET